MKRSFRLAKSTDFKRVRRFGKSFAHPLIVLIVHPSGHDQSRFAVAAGKGVGNAVQRNRAKRILRAALQTWMNLVAPGWDVIAIARRPLLKASFQEVLTAINDLLLRAKLITTQYDGYTRS